MTQPYSTVIPAHNAAETLEDTLASVLAQTAPCDDVIVVNDGSTDATAEIAAAFGGPVRVISQANAGAGAATNAGVAAARHPVIAFVDADDLWLPGKMAAQLPDFADPAAPLISYAALQCFRHADGPEVLRQVIKGATRSSLVITRTVFDLVGPIIDPPGGRGDLIDWLARVRELGVSEIAHDDVLALRRIIPGSLSYGRDAERDRGYLSVVHQAMLRRRTKEAKG